MTKMMNGIRGSSGNEIKYPVNCAARLSSAAYGANGAAMNSPAAIDDLYEPRPNKRFFRVVTVIGYMFSISFGAILLSLYYLFLWDPYKEKEKVVAIKQLTTTTESSTSLVTTSSPLSMGASATEPTANNLLNTDNSAATAAALAVAATAVSASSLILTSVMPSRRPLALAAATRPPFNSKSDLELDSSKEWRASSRSWQLDNPFSTYAKALRSKTENHVVMLSSPSIEFPTDRSKTTGVRHSTDTSKAAVATEKKVQFWYTPSPIHKS